MNEQNNNVNNAINSKPIVPNLGTNEVPINPVSASSDNSVENSAPVAQTIPVLEQTPVVQATPVVEQTPLAQATPVVEQTPVVEAASVVEQTPVAQPTPAVEQTPVAQPTPVVEQTPVAQATPAVEQTPVVEAAPVVTPSPVAQPLNNNQVSVNEMQQNIVSNPIPVVSPIAQSPNIVPTIKPSQPQPMNDNANNIGFIPNNNPIETKKKNKGVIIFIVIALLAIITFLGIFVIWPMVKKSLTTPKMVYTTAIQSVTKEINAKVEDIIHDKNFYDISVGVDSNMPTISELNGYRFGVNAGIDSNKKALQVGLYMNENEDSQYSLYNYIKDGKMYSKYSTDNILNYLGDVSDEELNELFAALDKILEEQENYTSEDINYLINKFSELLISSFDEEKFVREETSISINGKNTKVLNNKYVINKDTAEAMGKHILNGLKSDSKVVTILAKMSKLTEDEIKEMLTYSNEDNETESDDDTTLTLSIYTDTKLEKSLGFSLKDSDDEGEIHYYTNDDAFEFVYSMKSLDIETNKDIEDNLTVSGVVKDKKTNITVTMNKEKIMSFVINEKTETKLDLNYEIFIEDGATVSGKFTMNTDRNDKRIKTDYTLSVKSDNQYINVDLSILIDWDTDIAKINVGNAVTVTAEQEQVKLAELLTQISQTKVGVLLQALSQSMNSNQIQYDTNYDSYSDEYGINSNVTYDNNL